MRKIFLLYSIVDLLFCKLLTLKADKIIPDVVAPEVYVEAYETNEAWVLLRTSRSAGDGTNGTNIEDETSNFNGSIILDERSNSIGDETNGAITLDQDGDVSILDKRVENVVLSCRANYPVYWTMKDVYPEYAPGMKIRTIAEFDEDEFFSWNKTEFKVKRFNSKLLLYNHASYTGLYTCRSVVDDDKLQTDMYVFFQGEKEQRIFATGKVKTKIMTNGKTSVVIPCRVTRKDAVVTLSRKTETEEFTPVNTTFDPKVGFVVDDISSNETFKCTTTSGDTLTVNVIQGSSKDKHFQNHISTAGKAGWARRRVKDGVQCCSNSSIGPSLLIFPCENKPTCDMTKKIFEEIHVTPKTPGLTDVSRRSRPCVYTGTYGFVQPFLMQCKGDGVDISGEFVTRFELPSKDEVTYELRTSNYTYVSEKSVKITARKISNVSYDDLYYRVRLVEVDTTKDLFVGDRFGVDCCGLSYDHAAGRVQRIGWKNGSVTIMQTPDKKNRYSSPMKVDFCYWYRGISSEDEDQLLIANENMEFFECIIPLWNKTEAVVTRLQLNIREPEEPEFAPGHNVTVTYDENQYGLLKLDCIVSKGIPNPNIFWTRDGYKVNITDKFWSVEKISDTESSLLFMRAVKEIGGEFECVAENYLGTTAQIYVVKVRPRSYMDYWIALAIFGGFFALIICCALRVTTLEKKTLPKKVEPLEDKFTQ